MVKRDTLPRKRDTSDQVAGGGRPVAVRLPAHDDEHHESGMMFSFTVAPPTAD
jgi:hypothetical protein